MKINANDYIEKFIGKKVKDKVTGMEGTVDSISFDLYGCIQVLINPGVDKDNKQIEKWWMDTIRLEIIDNNRVLPVPPYDHRLTDDDKTPDVPGPANKPTF